MNDITKRTRALFFFFLIIFITMEINLKHVRIIEFKEKKRSY
jgi:hypothetical protein